MKKYLSVFEVAARVGVSVRTIQRWIKEMGIRTGIREDDIPAILEFGEKKRPGNPNFIK